MEKQLYWEFNVAGWLNRQQIRQYPENKGDFDKDLSDAGMSYLSPKDIYGVRSVKRGNC